MEEEEEEAEEEEEEVCEKVSWRSSPVETHRLRLARVKRV